MLQRERRRERVMVGGCASTKENLFSRAVKEAGSSKEKERATSRIVFQGVVCCIVTCFDCGVGTRFLPSNQVQRKKKLGVCEHRNNKRGRKTGRERVWEQQSYVTNGSSMGATRGELLGFCKSQNDALLSLSLSLPPFLPPSLSLIHTHTHTMQQMAHTPPINVLHTKEATPMHSLSHS